MGDVEIGDRDFDANFIVRANDPARGPSLPSVGPGCSSGAGQGGWRASFVKDGFLHMQQKDSRGADTGRTAGAGIPGTVDEKAVPRGAMRLLPG